MSSKAQGALTDAPTFVVQVEVHANVATRTSIDPRKIVRFIAGIRDVTIKVIQDKDGVIGVGLDMDKPFFDQFPLKSCDILMVPKITVAD